MTPLPTIQAEVVREFEKEFLNSDPVSSISQFKPELSGKLPHAFEQFLIAQIARAYEAGRQSMYEETYTRDIQEELKQAGRDEAYDAILRLLDIEANMKRPLPPDSSTS